MGDLDELDGGADDHITKMASNPEFASLSSCFGILDVDPCFE